MNNKVHILDTTLRDGEQCPGKVFSPKEKISIAKKLEEMKVYQIEAGVPAMGGLEKETIKIIIQNSRDSFISTWNRMNINDIKQSIECKPHIIHISVPTSDIQIFSKLRKDKAWVEKKIVQSINFAKEHNYEVSIGFEDASRTEMDYLLRLCNILDRLEVSTIRYADTVGILTPSKVREAISTLKRNINMDIEIHAHNDFGMAIANSIEAVKAGAKYVNCTLDGIGERSGNCNLQEFIRATKKFFYIN